MLRLHYFPPTCSLASMTALELVGAVYEPVLQDIAGDRSSLLAISPLGQIPVLEKDDGVITDTAAIIYWISRRFPEARLLPAHADGLTTAMSRMGWLGCHLHIVRRRYFMPCLFGAPEEAAGHMRAVARPIYWKALQQLDCWIGQDVLGGLGVEAYALLFYHWALMDGLPAEELKHLSALARRMVEIEGVRRALELHNSPLLADAA